MAVSPSQIALLNEGDEIPSYDDGTLVVMVAQAQRRGSGGEH